MTVVKSGGPTTDGNEVEAKDSETNTEDGGYAMSVGIRGLGGLGEFCNP